MSTEAGAILTYLRGVPADRWTSTAWVERKTGLERAARWLGELRREGLVERGYDTVVGEGRRYEQLVMVWRAVR